MLLDGDALALPEIGVELPLADLYADVEIGEPGTEAG